MKAKGISFVGRENISVPNPIFKINTKYAQPSFEVYKQSEHICKIYRPSLMTNSRLYMNSGSLGGGGI